MMRWNYTAPEKKTFVSDGRKIYSYIPEDRQVIVSDVVSAHLRSLQANHLTDVQSSDQHGVEPWFNDRYATD